MTTTTKSHRRLFVFYDLAMNKLSPIALASSTQNPKPDTSATISPASGLLTDVTQRYSENGFYVAPTEFEDRWIIGSTNMSSLRDDKLMDFDRNNANFQSSDRSEMVVVR
ncbi:MAG: hypothetical protein WBW71_02315, partial [Bacteroidota bacterium]